tara:strand:+ start:10005 stop:10631 length:627 start_codon:yes stop_codon:yes gene_type:complete
MEAANNPININISKNDEKTPIPYSEFKKYIIVNNIELQRELKASIENVKTLEATIAEKESEEDKYDNRIRYMKGLIQNLNEIKLEYSYLHDKENEKFKLVNKQLNSVKYKHMKNYICGLIIFIANIILKYSDYLTNSNITNLIIYLSYSFVLCYTVHVLFQNYTTISIDEQKLKKSITLLDSQIKEKKIEIKKIEDATLSLDNWVCEI